MESLRPEKEIGMVERLGQEIVVRRAGSSEIVGRVKWREQSIRGHAYLYIFGLSVFDRSDRGKGFSSQLIESCEVLCRERGVPGMLDDAIQEHESPQAVGMYGRRDGWMPIPQSESAGRYWSFVYNLQPGQKPSDFWLDTEDDSE